jgi:hypothetical protein
VPKQAIDSGIFLGKLIRMLVASKVHRLRSGRAVVFCQTKVSWLIATKIPTARTRRTDD